MLVRLEAQLAFELGRTIRPSVAINGGKPQRGAGDHAEGNRRSIGTRATGGAAAISPWLSWCTSASMEGLVRLRAAEANGAFGPPPDGGPWGGHREARGPGSCSKHQAAQNSKPIERLTRASPAKPVAARIDKEWITGSSNKAKT